MINVEMITVPKIAMKNKEAIEKVREKERRYSVSEAKTILAEYSLAYAHSGNETLGAQIEKIKLQIARNKH